MTCVTRVFLLALVRAGEARPGGAAEGDVPALLRRLWDPGAGAGCWNRGRRHHAPQHLPALGTGQGQKLSGWISREHISPADVSK